MRRTLALATLAAAAAGCIPSRDNPHDPAVRPGATLRVLDLGALPDSECLAAVVSGTALDPVVVASRGRCLALDARDPDATGGGNTPSYRFRVPGVAEAFEPGGATLVLDPDTRRDLPVGELIEFEVEARRGGGVTIATASIVLSNEKPVAVVAPPRRVPLGGFPWAPGDPMPTVFDGSASYDPDGDPLSFSWVLPDGTLSDQPIASSELAPGSSDARATLVVSDGHESSRRATSIVHPSDRPLLYGQAVGILGGEGAAQRFDTEPALVLDTALGVYRVADLPPHSADPVHRITWLREASGGGVEVVLADAATGLATDVLPERDGSAAFDVDPLTGTVWILFEDAGADVLESYDASGGVFAPLDSFALTSFDDLGASVAALPGGSAFVSDRERVLRVDPAAQTPVTTVGDAVPGERMFSFSVRPDVEEVWEVRTGNNAVTDLHSALVVRSFDGVELRRLELGEILVAAFAWIDRDEAWLVVAGDGLRRVDALLLEQGASLADSTIVRIPFPSVYILETAFGGPANIAWVSAPGEVLVALPDGASRRFELSSPRPHRVDVDGALWFGAQGLFATEGLTRSATVDPHGRITANVMNGLVLPSVDASSGLVWFASGIPFGLVQMGPDGQIVRYEPEVLLDGALAPAPTIAAFAVAPDGRSAWGGSYVYDAGLGTTVTSVLYRYDLSQDPPAVTTVLDRPASDPFLLTSIHPTTPAFSDEAAWFVKLDAGQFRVGLLYPNGTFIERFAVPPGALLSPRPSAVRSLRTDSACVLWREPGPTVHLRRVDTAGVVTVLFDGAPPPGFDATGSAVSDDGGAGDACWVLFSSADLCADTDLTISGWTTAGGPAFSTTLADAGDAFSVVAFSSDELWVSHGCESDVPYSRTQLLRDGAAWTRRDIDTSQATVLVGPERGLP